MLCLYIFVWIVCIYCISMWKNVACKLCMIVEDWTGFTVQDWNDEIFCEVEIGWRHTFSAHNRVKKLKIRVDK